MLLPQFLTAQTYLFRYASFMRCPNRNTTWEYNTRSNLCCITYEEFIHKCEIIIFYEFMILFLPQDKLEDFDSLPLWLHEIITRTKKLSFLALSRVSHQREIYARMTLEFAEFSVLLAKCICVILIHQLAKSRFSLFCRKRNAHEMYSN